MMQLRQDYEAFKANNSEVLVMVPNGPRMIERYIQKDQTPYPILMDKGLKVAAQYFQVKKLFLIGTPSVFLVNQHGKIGYVYYAKSPIEEPDNQEPLSILRNLK